jgi:hypothetical protein
MIFFPNLTLCGVFDFCNTHQFQVFEKTSESKNRLFWVFENFQNQRTIGSRYLKKNHRFKEPLGLGISETSKNHRVS